jgi:hypothetical protein
LRIRSWPRSSRPQRLVEPRLAHHPPASPVRTRFDPPPAAGACRPMCEPERFPRRLSARGCVEYRASTCTRSGAAPGSDVNGSSSPSTTFGEGQRAPALRAPCDTYQRPPPFVPPM